MKKSSLKILTFNLGILIPNKNSYTRLELFLNKIKDADYDLIFLQEIWPKGLREQIIKKSGFSFALNLDNSTKQILKLFPSKLQIDSGLLILSKYKIDNPLRLKFSQNGFAIRFLDGESLVSKGAIGCDIEIENKKIFIATTHLVSHYKTCSYRFQRRQQFAELRNWLDQYSQDNPIILAGDFNFSPPCPNGKARYMNTDKDWLEGKHYFSEFNHINYHKITTTYPHRFNLKSNRDEGCVDHIFSTVNLEICDEKTLYHDLHQENGKEFYISDHLALEAKIKVL